MKIEKPVISKNTAKMKPDPLKLTSIKKKIVPKRRSDSVSLVLLNFGLVLLGLFIDDMRPISPAFQ